MRRFHASDHQYCSPGGGPSSGTGRPGSRRRPRRSAVRRITDRGRISRTPDQLEGGVTLTCAFAHAAAMMRTAIRTTSTTSPTASTTCAMPMGRNPRSTTRIVQAQSIPISEVQDHDRLVPDSESWWRHFRHHRGPLSRTPRQWIARTRRPSAWKLPRPSMSTADYSNGLPIMGSRILESRFGHPAVGCSFCHRPVLPHAACARCHGQAKCPLLRFHGSVFDPIIKSTAEKLTDIQPLGLGAARRQDRRTICVSNIAHASLHCRTIRR